MFRLTMTGVRSGAASRLLDEARYLMLQVFYTPVIFNLTTPSSAGAAGATTFANPGTNNIVNGQVPADATVELVNDIEWIMAMGER
mgnify:CR=1 FL=1